MLDKRRRACLADIWEESLELMTYARKVTIDGSGLYVMRSPDDVERKGVVGGFGGKFMKEDEI
jgi:hypothetical protein